MFEYDALRKRREGRKMERKRCRDRKRSEVRLREGGRGWRGKGKENEINEKMLKREERTEEHGSEPSQNKTILTVISKTTSVTLGNECFG